MAGIMKTLRYLAVLFAAACLMAAPPARKSAPAAKTAAAAHRSAPLDLNSATEAQLKQLPGIGDAFAKKIVDNRPYNSKYDLVRRNIIPRATYDKMKDDVVARQATKKK